MTPGRLADKLGYQFKDKALLKMALTHRSFGSPNNERLEFLGDSLLNCAIAAELYARFPDHPEGDLSRLRANLVRQDALHQLALGLQLGELMRLGEGELKTGGQQRPSILADALEAVLGAIFLDAGFEAGQRVVIQLYQPLLNGLFSGQVTKDAKTRLQEWLQGRRKALPRYVLLETSGEAHLRQFAVACEIDHPALRTEGQGTSRRMAEQMAAEQALKALNA